MVDWTTLLGVGVLIVVLMWGPRKIPDVARSLGKARREFGEAFRGVGGSYSRTEVRGDPLTDAAQRLGITTKGKSRQQISDDIVNAAKRA